MEIVLGIGVAVGLGVVVWVLVQWLKSMQNTVAGSTSEVSKRLNDLNRQIGEIAELGRGMRSLQEFLQSPKLRGNIGEQVLKDTAQPRSIARHLRQRRGNGEFYSAAGGFRVAFRGGYGVLQQAFQAFFHDGGGVLCGGRELILGGRQDPQFGPVVLVGLGGIFVEVFEEVVVRVAPISHREAHEMVQSLRGYAVLTGARGSQPADIPALEEALLRLSQLLSDFPEIKEIDINPLRVFQADSGCRALDARVIL